MGGGKFVDGASDKQINLFVADLKRTAFPGKINKTFAFSYKAVMPYLILSGPILCIHANVLCQLRSLWGLPMVGRFTTPR